MYKARKPRKAGSYVLKAFAVECRSIPLMDT